METWLSYVNIILALSVPIVLVGGLWNSLSPKPR